MSEVEQLANKYFEEQCMHTYADNLEELKEDVVSAYMQGYAKGETDEQFRTKQLVTEYTASLEKENAELKMQLTEAKKMIMNFLAYEKGEAVIIAWLPFLKQAEQFIKEE